jgi:glycine/D-amino acid oxidase-like deaminating enzyme
LVELEPAFAVDPSHPVCWNVETDVYFRPRGKLVLACPGDETPHPPKLPDVDPNQIEALRRALAREAPSLESAEVVRVWACLRTRCSDGGPAIGRDPETDGLYWLAGLGGHGLTVGLAAGELLARSMAGVDDPLADAFSPARLTR